MCPLESLCLHQTPRWTAACRFSPCAGRAATCGFRAASRANVSTAVGRCTAATGRGRASARSFRMMTTDVRPRTALRRRPRGTTSQGGRALRTLVRRPCLYPLHRRLRTRPRRPSMVRTDPPSATGRQIGPPHAVAAAPRVIRRSHAHTIRYTASAGSARPGRASPISWPRQAHMSPGRSSRRHPPRACATDTTARCPCATGSTPDW